MHLEIVTPDAKVFEGEVKSATFPGTDGFFQVLNNHAPLISSLSKGQLSYIDNEKKEFNLKIDGGVVEILNNEIIVLAEGIIEK